MVTLVQPPGMGKEKVEEELPAFQDCVTSAHIGKNVVTWPAQLQGGLGNAEEQASLVSGCMEEEGANELVDSQQSLGPQAFPNQ